MWARKNKNRPVSVFFTKIARVQVMNFIPVKVSTLYVVWSKGVSDRISAKTEEKKIHFVFLFVYPLLLVGCRI
jgi:hypothetical protein